MDQTKRWAAFIIAILAAVPLLVFLGVWVSIGPSWVGGAYIIVLFALWLGLLTARWRVERFRGWTHLSLAALIILVLASGARDPDSPMKLGRVVAPNFGGSFGNRLVPERDALLVGTTFALYLRGDPEERPGPIVAAMDRAYEQAEKQGSLPSPWFATYVGLQSSASFDMQVLDVEGADAAVIFMHGFGGNFTIFCWEVAQAAAAAGVATLCPSTEWLGMWWLDDAQKTLGIAMEKARKRGYRRLYIAGLSNGGRALSWQTDELHDQVVGFIYISGVAEDADPVRGPALVIHGEGDRRISADLPRQYAAGSEDAQYVGIDGGHFIIVDQSKLVRSTISDWLRSENRRVR